MTRRASQAGAAPRALAPTSIRFDPPEGDHRAELTPDNAGALAQDEHSRPPRVNVPANLDAPIAYHRGVGRRGDFEPTGLWAGSSPSRKPIPGENEQKTNHLRARAISRSAASSVRLAFAGFHGMAGAEDDVGVSANLHRAERGMHRPDHLRRRRPRRELLERIAADIEHDDQDLLEQRPPHEHPRSRWRHDRVQRSRRAL